MTAPTMVRIYRAAGTPAAAGITMLLGAGWELTRWPWLGMIAAACAAATVMMVFANDLFFDPRPSRLPAALKMITSWVRANLGLVSYPLVTVVAFWLAQRIDWLWLPDVGAFASLGFLLEVAAAVIAYRTGKMRGPRQCTRALLSSMVATWVDGTLFFLLVGHWLLAPAQSGVQVLHVAVPLLTVSLVLDIRGVWLYRAFWPWRR